VSDELGTLYGQAAAVDPGHLQMAGDSEENREQFRALRRALQPAHR
jgi:hypothetical protein